MRSLLRLPVDTSAFILKFYTVCCIIQTLVNCPQSDKWLDHNPAIPFESIWPRILSIDFNIYNQISFIHWQNANNGQQNNNILCLYQFVYAGTFVQQSFKIDKERRKEIDLSGLPFNRFFNRICSRHLRVKLQM